MENFRYIGEDELKQKMSSRKTIVILISLTPLLAIFLGYSAFGKISFTPLVFSIIIYSIGSLMNKIAYKDYKMKEKSYLEGEKIKAEMIKNIIK